MPTLYPVGEGDPIEVADTDVAAKLRGGLYRPKTHPAANGEDHVRLVGPDGTFYSSPVNHAADYIEKNGYRLAQPADEFAHDNPKLGSAAAALGGLANAATVGGATPAFDALTGGDWTRAITQQHPGWRYGVEIPSSLLLSFAGAAGALKTATSAAELETAQKVAQLGETLAVTSKADVAADALKGVVTSDSLKKTIAAVVKAPWNVAKAVAPYTPTGKVAQWSSEAQESLASAVTKELTAKGDTMGMFTHLAANMGKVGSAFAGPAAAEGALWGISTAVNEKALGDPREWGELLWTEMAESAALGGALGAAAGAFKGALGAGARRTTRRVAAFLEEQVQPDGGFGKPAVDELRAQTLKAMKGNLTNKQLGDIESALGQDEFHAMAHDRDLIPQGAKPGMEGGSLFVTRAGRDIQEGSEVIERAQAGQKVHGEQIGAIKDFMTARQNEVMEQYRARGIDIGTPGARPSQFTEFGPFTDMTKVADRINEELTRLAPEGAAPLETPLRRTLMAEEIRLRKMGASTNDDIKRLQGEYQQYWNVRNPTGAEQTAGAAYRKVDTYIRAAQKETALTAWGADGRPLLEPEMVEQWKYHDNAYHALTKLNDALSETSLAGAPVSGLMNYMKRAWSKAAWAMSFRGSFAMRSIIQSVLGGRVPTYGTAALLMTPISAVAGAAGSLALQGMLPSRLPTAERMAEIAYRASCYKSWGSALTTLDNHAANLVAQWTRNPGKLARGAEIVGEEFLKKQGEDSSPSLAAQRLMRRVAAVAANPEMLAASAQQLSAHISGAAPTAALACGSAYGRACQINHVILQQLNDSRRILSFQPALSAKQPYSKDALSKAGRQLAAVAMPKKALQRILAGIATDDEIKTFKMAHPQYYVSMLKHLASAVTQMQTPLTPHQLSILKRLGFSDSTTHSMAPSVMPATPQPTPMASRQLRVSQQQQGQAPAVSRFQHLKPEGLSFGHSPSGEALKK